MYSCNEIGEKPCHCRSEEYKVELNGGVINCISIKNPWNHSYGCREKCHGRKHDWENEVAFPKREAYTCIRPIAGKQFITEHLVIQDCRKCQKNEVATGCDCYNNRYCECPNETHYVDEINDCVPRDIQSSSGSSSVSAVQNTIDLIASRNLSPTSTSSIYPTPSSTLINSIESDISPSNYIDSAITESILLHSSVSTPKNGTVKWKSTVVYSSLLNEEMSSAINSNDIRPVLVVESLSTGRNDGKKISNHSISPLLLLVLISLIIVLLIILIFLSKFPQQLFLTFYSIEIKNFALNVL